MHRRVLQLCHALASLAPPLKIRIRQSIPVSKIKNILFFFKIKIFIFHPFFKYLYFIQIKFPTLLFLLQLLDLHQVNWKPGATTTTWRQQRARPPAQSCLEHHVEYHRRSGSLRGIVCEQQWLAVGGWLSEGETRANKGNLSFWILFASLSLSFFLSFFLSSSSSYSSSSYSSFLFSLISIWSSLLSPLSRVCAFFLDEPHGKCAPLHHGNGSKYSRGKKTVCKFILFFICWFFFCLFVFFCFFFFVC